MIKNAGVWAGVILLAFSGLLIQQSFTLDYINMLGPGPGFLPRWLGGLLGLVSLCYLWDACKHNVIDVGSLLPSRHALPDIALMLLGLCLFALLVETIGFVLAASQLLFLMSLRKFRWQIALPTSIAISVALLLAFQKLLGVFLPVNDFGW